MRPAAATVAAAVTARAELPGTGRAMEPCTHIRFSVYNCDRIRTHYRSPRAACRLLQMPRRRHAVEMPAAVHEEEELCVCELTAALGEISAQGSAPPRAVAQVRAARRTAARANGCSTGSTRCCLPGRARCSTKPRAPTRLSCGPISGISSAWAAARHASKAVAQRQEHHHEHQNRHQRLRPHGSPGAARGLGLTRTLHSCRSTIRPAMPATLRAPAELRFGARPLEARGAAPTAMRW